MLMHVLDYKNPRPNKYDELPPGEYPVKIEKVKINAPHSGVYITTKVTEGEFKGRRKGVNCSLDEDELRKYSAGPIQENSETAIDIGSRIVEELGSSCGCDEDVDLLDDLVGKEVIAKVVNSTREKGRTEIVGFKPIGRGREGRVHRRNR